MSEALLALAADDDVVLGPRVPAGLVELAQRHGLIPILAQHVEEPLVQAIAVREAARRTVLHQHLRCVLADLHAAEVPTAVLKGPVIATRYRNPANRTFSDLDLLVREHKVEDALEVLRQYPATVNVPEKRPRADKRDVLLRDETGISFNVDLHWDLFSYTQLRGSADGATEGAWEAATEDTDSPLGPHWVLPDSYRLAFLCAHAILDHRFRLILFRDFLELCRGPVPWEGLETVARRWGLRSTTYLALWLGSSALGVPVPMGVLSDLRPRSLPVKYLEWALPRTDLIRFDGHRPHPINLASVLLNDSVARRLSLILRGPGAFPGWRRRVTADFHQPGAPRALILVSTDRRRGAEVFTERLREGLLVRGWVVEAVSLRGTGSEPRADVEPLTMEAEGSGGRFDWALARALRRKVRTYRPGLIIANGGATLRYSLAARLGLGIDLAYIGIGEPQYWIRSRSSRWANRMMLRLTDVVLAVSETTRRQIVALEPSVKGKSFTVFTGIERSSIDMRGRDPSGPLRVVMVGSLTSEKDPSLALRAVAAIEDAHLRFVGDGPLAASLGRHSDELGMADRVEFVGSVNDVSVHLEWAHLLILTSLTEGLPGAILEASAAGLPVVAVDVGGVREAVLDGETGFVTGREVSELVDRLRRLNEDRGLLSKMGQEGRRYISENFLIEDVVERYHSVLKSRPK